MHQETKLNTDLYEAVSLSVKLLLSWPFSCIVLCRSLSQQELQEVYIFLRKRCALRFAHTASVYLYLPHAKTADIV